MLKQKAINEQVNHLCLLSAGSNVDEKAVSRRGIDLPELKKLSEAYRMGWLHNILSRITPLTLRSRDDYLAMADIFIENKDSAENILDRFDDDMELFCSMAEIHVTKHMSAENVSDELKSHVQLYNDIADIFYRKFGVVKRDPIQNLALSPIMTEASNPFIKEFMDDKFERKKR